MKNLCSQKTQLKSGHEVRAVVGKEDQKLKDELKAFVEGGIRLRPGNWFFPTAFVQFADQFFDFEFKPTDVVIMSFMKCGTTWMQEIVWTMKNNPNLGNPDEKIPINSRSSFLECDMFLQNVYMKSNEKVATELRKLAEERCSLGFNETDGVYLHMTKTAQDPRIIKTHLPFSLLHPNLLETCKVIYVARNPPDVIVSMFHHMRLFRAFGFTGTLDHCIDNFLTDSIVYSPLFAHLKKAWNKKGHRNLHFVLYEDLLSDIRGNLELLNKFLETNLSASQIDKIIEFTSFGEMAKRCNVFTATDNRISYDDPYMNADIFQKDGGFFRKGKGHSWKEVMTDEQANKVRKWIRDNTQDFDLHFAESETIPDVA